jgi:hypothetical protein
MSQNPCRTAAGGRIDCSRLVNFTFDGKAYTGDTVALTGTALGNFNTKDVTVSVRDTLSGLDDIVYPDVRMATADTVSIVFDQAPAGGITPQTYRVVVTG